MSAPPSGLTARLVALTATALLLLTAAITTVWATEAAGPFPDVPADSPFAGDISWLVERGITTGYADGTFRPTAPVSRQAFAAYLFRYVTDTPGGPCLPGTSTFVDVDDESPFCKAITWLSSRGITTGYPDGTFRPTSGMSRQALAAFLFRLHHHGANSTPCSGGQPFPDVAATSDFCSAIVWLTTSGPPAITTGYADGTFRPIGISTRQAVAAYLHRYDLAYADKGGVGEPVPLRVTTEPLTQSAYPTMLSSEVVVVQNDNAFDVRVTDLRTDTTSPEPGCATALAALRSAGSSAVVAIPDARDTASIPARSTGRIDVQIRFSNDLPQACEDAPLSVSFTVTGSS